jgi:hypothetical protein
MARSIRGVIEIITAILLGLVSVTTALGAYQASLWALESADYRLAATQMRDRNLTELLTAQLIFKADGAKLYEAFTLESEATLYPERAAEVARKQASLLGSASPGFAEDWEAWKNADYAPELAPITQPEYEARLFSQPQSLQYGSFVANTLADEAMLKSSQVTITSVIFAISLLLLGVAGANASWKIAATLAGAATLTYLGGLVFTLVAVL